jgi:hypothetical protein
MASRNNLVYTSLDEIRNLLIASFLNQFGYEVFAGDVVLSHSDPIFHRQRIKLLPKNFNAVLRPKAPIVATSIFLMHLVPPMAREFSILHNIINNTTQGPNTYTR